MELTQKKGNSSRRKEKSTCGCNCLTKISNFITNAMESFFYRLGKLVGQSPWITILITLIIAGACSAGLLKFTEESRGEKLWVPQDSISLEHQEWVNDKFPSKSRVARTIFTASNVLTPEVLKKMLTVDKQVKAINNGTKDNWENICYRLAPTVCFTSSLLELWSYNETTINSLTQEDIMDKINEPQLKSPVTGRKVILNALLGASKRNSAGAIISAEAAATTYLIKNQEEVIGGSKVDKVGEEWESSFGSLLDSLKLSSVKIFYFTRSSLLTAIANSLQSDYTLLSAGYVLIIVYVAIMLGRFTRLRLKAWLALFGVICVCMAIGVSFGLSSAFGVFYGPVHGVLPFLLLGIGVDDMFVIVQAWTNLSPETHKKNDIPERVGLALKHAGVSITITSLTDFLAFVIGATTVLPALRSFCVFAGVGILAEFVFQATFFTAWMAIDARRQDKGRDSCCCCIKLSESYTESEYGMKDNLQVFFKKFIAPVFLSLPGKIIIMIITGVLFGFNMYGTLMLKQNFDRAWFLPPDSMAYKYTIVDKTYFPVEGASTAVYTGKIDYFKEQGNLHKIHEVALSDKYIVQSSVNSWFQEYLEWTKKVKGKSYVNNDNQIADRTLFYNWLKEYLMTTGRSYARNVVYPPDSTDNTVILASRMEMKHKDVKSTQIEVEAMEQFRKSIKDIPLDGEHFAYSSVYTRWETNKIIKVELYRNMALALAAVFVVTLLVLANFWTCLMVVSSIGFTLVCILGTCHFWGVYIETVSTICLVLAVGLTVDYASHVAHTFMVTSGTNEERAFLTLHNIGPAVWNGGFSTFLAFILLVSSNNYAFTVFFKIFFSVVVFGLFHGLCYLPVLLSSIGPPPYESAVVTPPERKANVDLPISNGKVVSPVHPVGSRRSDNGNFDLPISNGKVVSPVHPVGSRRSENDSYDLPIANGKAVNKPPNQFCLESNGSVNHGFDIPPPDYHNVDLDRIVRNALAQVNPGFT